MTTKRGWLWAFILWVLPVLVLGASVWIAALEPATAKFVAEAVGFFSAFFWAIVVIGAIELPVVIVLEGYMDRKSNRELAQRCLTWRCGPLLHRVKLSFLAAAQSDAGRVPSSPWDLKYYTGLRDALTDICSEAERRFQAVLLELSERGEVTNTTTDALREPIVPLAPIEEEENHESAAATA